MMEHRARLIALAALASTAAATVVGLKPPDALFTTDERDAIVKFWSEPGRYAVHAPSDFEKAGPVQVRLTVPGSVWLREYNRRRGMNKVPPTATAKPQNDEQAAWQVWIDAKIEWDRWGARKLAEIANLHAAGHECKFDDKSLPVSEPADPGPPPPELIAFAGEPPVFASCVSPKTYEVVFPDGTRITYRDNVKMRKNYAYYRFESGVASEGVSTKSIPEDRLKRLCDRAGVSASELRVMKAVSMLEGGFDAVNTYDTGYVSVGFIQFATLKDGGNSLGEMLQSYKADDPSGFQADFRAFGIDVTPDAKVACIDPATGTELTGEAAARKIIDDKRLIAVFQYDGLKSDAYDAAQIKSAKCQFYPSDDPIAIVCGNQRVTGKISDVFKSEAAMATLMDRKVNTGKLDMLGPLLQQMADANQSADLIDLARFEYDLVAALQYRRDYLADTELSQPPALVRSKPLGSRGGDRSGRGGGGIKHGGA